MATVSTELRRYDFSCVLARWGMAISDERRERFKAWMAANDYTLYRVSKDTGVNYNTLRSYVGDGTDKITESLKGSNEAQIARAYGLTVEDVFGSDDGDDAPTNTNYLRAWRKFRHMTLDEVADAIGSTKATVQQLEVGRMSLSHKWLLKIAPVLGTTPGMLLDHDPNDLPTSVLETWAAIAAEDQPQALKVLESFKRTGTEG